MFKKMFNDRSSRNIIFFVATLIVVAMIIVAVTSNLPLKTFAEGEKTGEDIRRILNVFGNGKVTVEPDIAYIILGVVMSMRMPPWLKKKMQLQWISLFQTSRLQASRRKI